MKKLFIIGCDRSGTTVLARHIALNLRTYFLPEMQFLGEIINVSGAGLESSNMQHLFKPYIAYNVDFLNGINEIDTLDRAFQHVYYRLGLDFNKIDFYLDHTPWADKYLDQSLISNDIFFIHVIRNGNDVVQSLLSQKWGPNTLYYAQQHWSNRIIEIKKFLSDKNYIEVRFDDFIEDKENTITSVGNFLGVPKIDTCYSNDKMILSKSYAKQHQHIRSKKKVKKNYTLIDYSHHVSYINLMKNLFNIDIKFRKLSKSNLFLTKVYEVLKGVI